MSGPALLEQPAKRHQLSDIAGPLLPSPPTLKRWAQRVLTLPHEAVPPWLPMIIYSTPGNKRGLLQSAGVLDHHKDTELRPGDRVVQQASLAFSGTRDFVWP